MYAGRWPWLPACLYVIHRHGSPCMYVYSQTCFSICICFMYLCIYICTHILESECMHVYMYACMNVCTYAWVFFIWVHLYECMHKYIFRACRYVGMYAYMHKMYVYVDMYVCMYTYGMNVARQTWVCICMLSMHVWVYIPMHVCIPVCIYLYQIFTPMSLHAYLICHWIIWLHITNMRHTAIIIWINTPNIFAFVWQNKTKSSIYFTCYCHVLASNIYALQMQYKFHICKLVHAHIWHRLCQYKCTVWTHCNQQCDQEHWNIFKSLLNAPNKL